jgi:hypothetical protein
MSVQFSRLASRGSQSFVFFLSLLVLLLCGTDRSNAQSTPTNVQISGTVLQAPVHRLGVNLGDNDFWDSSQMMKNLVFENPGFEGLQYRVIFHCDVVTANTCQDDNQFNAQPAGFWKGGNFLVMSGSQAGTTGTVIASTVSGTCKGCGPTLTFGQNVNLAVGDYFSVENYFPGTGDAAWGDDTANGGTISTETTDLSPETPGKQALLLSANAKGQYAKVTQGFDTWDGLSFIQLNGVFSLTFRAKGVGGNNQLIVNAQRLTGSNPPYVFSTIVLTNGWKDYTLTFTANETGSSVGPVQVYFEANGGSIELDDVSLVQTNSSASNQTAFRDDVVSALKELNPGTIRMMAAGAALGSDIPNQLQVPFARYREGFNADGTSYPNIAYGIHEFLQLCQTVGADPWITIPTATTPSEMTDFIQYLTGTGNDSWSTLRINRGQSAPWTSVFNKIHIELGNETWNGAFKGETMNFPAYPQWANQVFGAARQTSGFQASKFDLILSGLAASPGYNQPMLSYSTQHDSFDIAPYLLYSANNEAQATMIGALFAEPELFSSAGGEVYQNMLVGAASPAATAKTTYVNVYETNLGTMGGTITQAQLNLLTPSIAAGIAHADHMLQMMRAGVKYQNAFALPQYEFRRSDQSLAKLWGLVVDMGTTNRRRPQFLTQALANSVIGGDMLQTVQSGGNPTWNQPLSSDNVVLNGAHFLQSFAFLNGATSSVVLFNLNQTLPLPVTFSGENAPTGSVQMTQLTSSNITDNNELSNVVQPATQTLNGFNAASGLSLPPFSMTVLSWTSSFVQAPAFSVAAGTYSTTQTVALSTTTAGATIYFTTDGSKPTTASTVYSIPITVSTTQTVNAIAVAVNLSNSPIAQASYVIQPVAASPVFSLATGTYNAGQLVRMTTTVPGATIYYTSDGSTPTATSKVYSAPVSVTVNQTLNAITSAPNFTNSAVTTAVYTIAPPTAAPVFSVPTGTYQKTQGVQMSDSQNGAAIYYTTDGSIPTIHSQRYSSGVAVSTSQTVNAIGYAPGYSASPVVSATYTIAPYVALPVLSVPGGTYNTPQTVTITDATPGATIYYTTNATTPTTSSTVYTGPVTIAVCDYLQVIAVAPGYTQSYVASANYNLTVGTPTFSVAAGTYSGTQIVSISEVTPGAAVFYTTNGSAPTTASTPYVGPITVSASETVRAMGMKLNYVNSATGSASYVINSASTASPVFSIAPGAYSSAQTVSISDTTSGSTIYYTTNGATPTTASAVYAGPITVGATETLSAIAVATGTGTSPVATATYTILAAAATPTFSVAPGAYSSPQTVAISSATAGATIYFTIDGSTPTNASSAYSGPITVSATETLKAIAIAANYNPSAVAAGTYTIAASNGINLSNGFSANQFDLNGSAALVGTSLQLTNGGYAEAGSAWYAKPVSVNGFTTDFDFQLPSAEADGFTFTIQNSSRGIYAKGGNGSGLGYQTINDSVAVAFNLYESGATNAESVGVYTGGASPQGGAVNLLGTGINLHSGDAFHIHMVYSGNTLTVTLTDKMTSATVTENFSVNIQSNIGGNSAYVGFTGSTGGLTSVQNILGWSFSN